MRIRQVEFPLARMPRFMENGVMQLASDALKPIRSYYRREVRLDLPPGAHFMYRGDNNMSPRTEPSMYLDADVFCSEFSGDDVIIVGHEKQQQYTLVGAVTALRSLTFLTLIMKGANMHAIEVRQPDIGEGDTPEEIIVLKGGDWRDLLAEYARRTARRMQVPPLDTRRNLTGYCTWYYYYAEVTEKDFLENVEAMRRHLDGAYRAQVVQIDDGYQTFQGDWNDQDPSWPTPLQEIGRRITGTGMRAGIWLMPFQASTASRVFREHPEWFVTDDTGAPKVAKGWSPPPDDLWACLDASQPAVQEHLARVFRTFRSWGYTYFKMDGLGFGLMEGNRADPAATPVSAFRQGLKAIRDAVPDAHLLGCCPPFMACLGYIDSARVSGDTHASWGRIRSCMHAVLSRWWMIDTFFRCDPDTMMARQDRGSTTPGEARVSILTGIVTGVAITSDNLNTITPERLALLSRAATIRMRDARPVDFKLWGHPSVFAGTVDGRRAVAAINETETAREFAFEALTLDPAREAEEILHPLGARKYTVTVPPHDAVLLVQGA